MAHSRIQLGPCCTVPVGGGCIGFWEIWDVPARHLREAKRDALARLCAAGRKRRSRGRAARWARQTETRA